MSNSFLKGNTFANMCFLLGEASTVKVPLDITVFGFQVVFIVHSLSVKTVFSLRKCLQALSMSTYTSCKKKYFYTNIFNTSANQIDFSV